MRVIWHLTDQDDTFYYSGDDGVYIDLIVDYGGNDTYYFYDDNVGSTDIQEFDDGGIDSVYLSIDTSYVMPEFVENLYHIRERIVLDGASGWIKGNDLDNIIDLKGNFVHTAVESFEGNDWVRLGWGEDSADLGEGDDHGYGGKGEDRIFGMAGDDLIYGGSQDDHLEGGDGRDTIYGERHDDYIDGGKGYDHLDGGDGNDTIFGGWGNDVIKGGSGKDFLSGGGRHDRIDGGSGADRIDGGSGNDTLNGGDDRDKFYFQDGDFGQDVVLGYTTAYEDQFIFSTEYWEDGAPSIEEFMLAHVSLVNNGSDVRIDLQDVGGGSVLIIGTNDALFQLDTLAGDIAFI